MKNPNSNKNENKNEKHYNKQYQYLAALEQKLNQINKQIMFFKKKYRKTKKI